MFDSRSCECVCENQKRGAAAAVVIRKLSYFFFLFFSFLVIYVYARVRVHEHCPYMYVSMLVLYVRTIVDSIILTVRFTIRNNICILFCLYFFHLFSIFSPMFRHFLVMVNCAGYISLYTIHNIHIICIRYNTCIIYSESIYLSERVIHRSAVLVDTRVLTLMTNYNCVCTFYIYVQSLT